MTLPRSYGLLCAAVIVAEAYVLFVDADASFRIEGRTVYEISEFASGGVVSHAFLMRGAGLQSVSVRFSSREATSVNVQWTLWRGYADRPTEMTRAFDGVEPLDLRPGPQWKTLTFARDGSSDDRWYTIELRLPEARPDAIPRVTVLASYDNPDRGGVLWVNNVRQPGSLFLRAEGRGRTLYRRFLAEAAPNLPGALRRPVVLWIVVVACHWAFMVLAYAMLTDGRSRAAVRAAS